MNRAYWIKRLKEAEAELDAATKPSEIRVAARKRRLAMEQLSWLDEQEKKKGTDDDR